MSRTLMRGFPLLSLVAAAVLAGPAPSQAAVTIGEDTSAPPGIISVGCSTTPGQLCTFAQSAHPTRSFASPIDGVIVRWRIRGDSEAAQFNLRVLRRNDGTFTGVGTGEPQTVLPDVENVFGTGLPIKQGELIGVNVPSGPAISIPRINQRSAIGAVRVSWNPALQDGETRAPTFTTASDLGLLYNADVEPDCDQDGFGDETQDTNLSSCAPGTTPTGPIPGPGGAPITCRGLNATIAGTGGNDVRTGTRGRDVIAGLGGGDTLSGIAGNDVICGGAGKDTLKGGKGKDSLLGQKGKDALKGGPGRDLCRGGKGTDTAAKCEVEKSI